MSHSSMISVLGTTKILCAIVLTLGTTKHSLCNCIDTWHHRTFPVQLYWHLAIKLYCIVNPASLLQNVHCARHHTAVCHWNLPVLSDSTLFKTQTHWNLFFVLSSGTVLPPFTVQVILQWANTLETVAHRLRPNSLTLSEPYCLHSQSKLSYSGPTQSRLWHTGLGQTVSLTLSEHVLLGANHWTKHH